MLAKNHEEVLENLFSYHPPKNEEEQKLHDEVNKASFDFAVAICKVVDNPAELTTLLRAIHEIRMKANCSVCFNRVGLSWRQLFE